MVSSTVVRRSSQHPLTPGPPWTPSCCSGRLRDLLLPRCSAAQQEGRGHHLPGALPGQALPAPPRAAVLRHRLPQGLRQDGEHPNAAHGGPRAAQGPRERLQDQGGLPNSHLSNPPIPVPLSSSNHHYQTTAETASAAPECFSVYPPVPVLFSPHRQSPSTTVRTASMSPLTWHPLRPSSSGTDSSRFC